MIRRFRRTPVVKTRDCPRCHGVLTAEEFVCARCSRALAARLVVLATRAGDVTVTVARLDRHGDRGPTSAERALPFDWDASDAAWAAHQTLVTWTRVVDPGCQMARQVGPACLDRGCHHRTCAVARVRAFAPAVRVAFEMGMLVGRLRRRADAAEGFDELHAACELIARLVDNPPARWYAGPCGAQLVEPVGERCETDLYARIGAGQVRCPDCGARWDAARRRDWLIGQAHDTLAHAGWMATALSSLLDRRITPEQIRGYAHRGRLVAHGRDEMGRPVYRVGDLLDVLARPRASLGRAALTSGAAS